VNGVPEPLLVRLGELAPQISPEAWVAPGAVLAGDVTIEAESSVWYGAVIRAELAAVHIGPGSNLQDNAVIHVDEGVPVHVEAEVSIGHGAGLHGCHIGSRTVVGMHATVLNGAEVGEECMLAAGTVVAQGRIIAPRSLVAGVPGKVLRELTDEEAAANLKGIRLYVTLSQSHHDSPTAR